MAINVNGIFLMDNLHSKMNEYWINVYEFANGHRWQGAATTNKRSSDNVAIQTKANGSLHCYRIHVKMKPRLPHIADYRWEDKRLLDKYSDLWESRFNGS